MKNMLISAFAICLAAAVPTALWAADEHNEQGGGRSVPAAQHSAPVSHTTGGMRGGARNAPSGGSMGGAQTRTHHATTQRDGGGMTGTSRTESTGAESTGTSRHRHTATEGTSGNTERATTRTRTNVDVSSYHKNITAERKYHFGDYKAPQGYSYHRYSSGDRLPEGYFGRDYWIINFLNFGLITPPDGYVWVRYGPDAVLIDEDTGEIVQVVYDVFY